jgi:amino acid transporter
MVLQSLGFGLDAAGVRGFVGSQAPLGDLAQHFVGWPLASALDVGAVLSAIGAGLGGVTVGARMIFAFARDGVVPRRLATVSPRARVPAAALAVEMLVGLLLLSAFRMAGSEPLDVFFYLATLGVLSLLVMYVVTNVAAVHRLVVTGSRWETLVPLAGTVVAGYVLYRNVWPLPPAPYRYFPYVVLAWLALAALATAVVPGLPARVSAGLARTRDRSSEQAG